MTNKQKFDLTDQVKGNSIKAIYKHNSYGPTFGGQHDLYLSNSSKSTTGNYCYVGGSSAYNTGDKNLLGNPGQTTFQVSHYEVYQVIFE